MKLKLSLIRGFFGKHQLLKKKGHENVNILVFKISRYLHWMQRYMRFKKQEFKRNGNTERERERKREREREI